MLTESLNTMSYSFSRLAGKIKKNYAERVGVAAGSIRLIFDGNPVHDTDTPRNLSLEDDDIIEAFVEQTGGFLGRAALLLRVSQD